MGNIIFSKFDFNWPIIRVKMYNCSKIDKKNFLFPVSSNGKKLSEVIAIKIEVSKSYSMINKQLKIVNKLVEIIAHIP